jgi:flagellar basal-body rod protein FlgC
MSLFTVFDIAGSGLSAQSVRLNVTASNLANADSVSSSVGETYRARHPIFASALRDAGAAWRFDDNAATGVSVKGIVESQRPLQKHYVPDHPAADDDGYIYMSNVNAVEEMANMISASRSYQSNVEVVNAAKQMMLRTLSLGQ